MDAKDILTIMLGVINLLILGLSTVLWFNYQELKKTANDAAKKVADHELYCARTYVTQEGLTQAISDLKDTIGSLVEAVKSNMEETRKGFKDLYDKVDRKQDK
jgi:hypothetical protein